MITWLYRCDNMLEARQEESVAAESNSRRKLIEQSHIEADAQLASLSTKWISTCTEDEIYHTQQILP